MAKKKQPVLGVHLLETITRGMYSDPFHSIREYIQNAYDSIRSARRSELLGPTDGTVKIIVDKVGRSLSIRDDGTGLSPEGAIVHLVDIGRSEKAQTTLEAQENAGFRGIGRMAGISYCKKLSFETSDGSGTATKVEFDAQGINRLTKPGQKASTIIEAIENNVQYEEETSEPGSHYLTVELQGIDPDSPFLNRSRLEQYLALNAPVAYDRGVWSYGDDIKSVAENVNSADSLESIKIEMCDVDGYTLSDIRRPFCDTFETTKANGRKGPNVSVVGIRQLPQGGSPGNGWWGWIAKQDDRRGQLGGVPFVGVRVRMHNIAVGDDSIVRELFPTKFRARWFFGEVHITDPGVVPNAQRDNFEASKRWDIIIDELKEQARLLDTEAARVSRARSAATSTIIGKAKKAVREARKKETAGFQSQDAQKLVAAGLETQVAKLNKAATEKKRPEPERRDLKRQLRTVVTTLATIKKPHRTTTDDALAHLDRKARKAVLTIFRVLKEELPSSQFLAIQEKIQIALRPGRKEA